MAFSLILLLAMQYSSFAGEPHQRRVRTAHQAVEVIRRHIRAAGGDLSREEITATQGRTAWHVTSWHIVDPSATGGNRFTPGGYTDYTVGLDGHIIETTGGL